MIKLLIYADITAIVLSIALGALVSLRSPSRVAGLSFLAAMLMLALSGFAEYMAIVTNDIVDWTRLAITADMLGLLPWTIFALSFARSEVAALIRKNKWYLSGLAISILVLIVVNLSGYYLFSLSEVENTLFILKRPGILLYVINFIAVLFVLINLEQTLRAASGVDRWRVKHFIVGVGAIMGFNIFFTSRILLYSAIDPAYFPLKGVIILIALLVMLSSFLRGSMRDTRVVVSRSLVYNSVTLVVVGVYLLAMGLMSESIKYLGVEYEHYIKLIFICIAVLVLVIFLLSEQVRRKTRNVIDRNLYKSSYDYRSEWRKITDRLTDIKSPEELRKTILPAVTETIGSKSASLWLVRRDNESLYLAEDCGMDIADGTTINGLLLKCIESEEGIVDLNGPERPGLIEGGADWELFREIRATLIVPLQSCGEFLGFILLGERLAGHSYDSEDFEILNSVAAQIASSMHNMNLAEELSTSREMDAFNRVSSFTMHDLKNLTNTLSMVSQNAADNMSDPEFQKDAVRALNGTVEKMEGLMGRLSAASNGVVQPAKKKVEISGLLGSVLAELGLNGSGNIKVVSNLDNLPRLMADQAEIETVLSNIVINACEAMGGEGEIKVSGLAENGFLKISIEDDGPGMTRDFIENSLFKPFKSSKKAGFGIGLYQSKAIIEAHGGTIEVESRPGGGTCFDLRLPLDNDRMEG